MAIKWVREERPTRSKIRVIDPVPQNDWGQVPYSFPESCAIWLIHNDSAAVIRYAFHDNPGVEFLIIGAGDQMAFQTRLEEGLWVQGTAAGQILRFLALEWSEAGK